MAERKDFLESFLSCHVCSETFKDPVTLKCNHSFCSSCLHQFWKRTQSKKCPVCRKKSSKKNTRLNFSLKELADSFAGRPSEAEEQKVVELCEKHPGEAKLFCRDEQRAVCPVCEFSLHQNHTVVPVEEAVRELKEELKSDIKSLTDRRDKFRGAQEKLELLLQHFDKQQLSTERQIRAEFNKLHQFLREEEESRVSALREEKEQKRRTVGRAVKEVQEKMSSLSESISAVEAELQKNEEAFLCTYKGVQNRARTQSSLSEPGLPSGALIDEAKHVGNLSLRVWEKMKEKVHFQPVLLDPNTASRWLLLSEDLTCVRNGETSQQLPDNPERNLKYSNVFGWEGFSSGRHSWEVEVGDHPHWNIGVANESVNRKEECSASPKYGIWCVVHRDGKYTNGDGEFLAVTTSLQKIRVQLDYDGGEVTFSNSADMKNICTHRHTFTQKLFPYFCVGKSRDAKTSQIQICPDDEQMMNR